MVYCLMDLKDKIPQLHPLFMDKSKVFRNKLKIHKTKSILIPEVLARHFYLVKQHGSPFPMKNVNEFEIIRLK